MNQEGITPLKERSDIPVKWIFLLSAVVILLAVLAVIVSIFIFPSPTIAQYRIQIALVCFALSSISCLLFAAKAELTGTIKLFAVTLAGPAAMWIVALIVFSHLYSETKLDTQAVLSKKLLELAEHVESRRGCITYNKWKETLGSFLKYYNRNEEFQLEQLLASAYYEGNERRKLTDPIIQTLFVYFDKKAVKFQRIQGKKYGPADIYFRATPTLPGSNPSSILLVREISKITDSYIERQGTWQEITGDPVDCLIIASYEEELPVGDLIGVDVTKYLKDGGATVDLGIIASRQINGSSFHLSKIRGSPFVCAPEIPLSFERHPTPPVENINSLISDLSPWMELIEQSINQPESQRQLSTETLNFLLDIRKGLCQATSPQSNFMTFLQHTNFRSKFSFHVEGILNSLIARFEWGNK
jgi:hypothetical protein